MARMARLQTGALAEAWPGEASDFTPLLVEQLDSLGDAIRVDLESLGRSEVQTAGGRRIDIVASDLEGSEFVIENQYGKADHDHLTRGLAYAVARRARGLIVVAEEHRDEFRALAEYLNELAELDPERGIAVWLVEATAVRIEDSPWAPLFTAVVQPNRFTAVVEDVKRAERMGSLDEFWERCESEDLRQSAQIVVARWREANHRIRLGPRGVVLEAAGPSANGYRTVVAIYPDGHALVPLGSYAGQNSGISIDSLTTPAFRQEATVLFGLRGVEKQAETAPGWLTHDRVEPLLAFCNKVADAYAGALQEQDPT